MTLTKYPVGLHALTNYFRCDITSWNNDTRQWILSRMKASVNNIKPIFVVLANESVKMYIPNADLTGLDLTPPSGEMIIWQRQNEAKAHWMKERTRIQKDTNLTSNQKSDQVNEIR